MCWRRCTRLRLRSARILNLVLHQMMPLRRRDQWKRSFTLETSCSDLEPAVAAALGASGPSLARRTECSERWTHCSASPTVGGQELQVCKTCGAAGYSHQTGTVREGHQGAPRVDMCFPRNATLIDSGLSSISVALWRHYSGIRGQAVLQPRDKAVAIVALLRTVTATNHAVVSHRVMCQR
jgi:hypothetical protein